MYKIKQPKYGWLQEIMQGDVIQKRHEMPITSNRTKQQPKWWVYSSYNVHLDMKSHTGIYTTIGNGATYTASWNWIQKLHQSRAIKNRRCNDTSTMDQTFLSITRSLCIYNTNLPGQQKYHHFGGDMAAGYKIFFHDRQNKEGGSKGSILPYDKHARRLLYIASTEQHFQKNVKQTTNFARYW